MRSAAKLSYAQAQAAMKAGKHVQVEIPLADSQAGAYAVAELAEFAARERVDLTIVGPEGPRQFQAAGVDFFRPLNLASSSRELGALSAMIWSSSRLPAESTLANDSVEVNQTFGSPGA